MVPGRLTGPTIMLHPLILNPAPSSAEGVMGEDASASLRGLMWAPGHARRID